MRELLSLITAPEKPIFLRGEIWVTPDVLKENGFSPGIEGIVEVASHLGADIYFYPWTETSTPSDIKRIFGLAHDAGLDVGLTIDGPFERITHRKNLLLILQELMSDPLGFRSQLSREIVRLIEILNLIREMGAELILLCDDLAYSAGLYFSLETFRNVLLPIYQTLTRGIAVSGLGWHSDGDVSAILPDLVDCGFRFFSLEPECVDLLNFKRRYGSKVALIGGLRTAWLVQEGLFSQQKNEAVEEIKALASEGGFILASTCGIFRSSSLPILREIYRLTEGISNTFL